MIKGWAWQWLSQLSFDADSWTAPQDAVRVGRDDAAAVTAAQILAHAARLRRPGETRIPLYVMDAGYDEAPVTWELRGHLDQVQILVRVRNDRVMYRDPAPEPGRPGRPRRHGTDRFECADPGTWGEPELRLARALAEDHRLPWERRRRPGRLTPGRVRRDFACLAALAGTPASPPKPSRAGPGRPKGRRSTQAPRYDVLKKAA